MLCVAVGDMITNAVIEPFAETKATRQRMSEACSVVRVSDSGIRPSVVAENRRLKPRSQHTN